MESSRTNKSVATPPRRRRIGLAEKYTYDFIYKKFKEKGYILLSTQYKNAHSKLQYICPKHKDKGILEMTWHDLRKNRSCKFCAIETRAEKHKKLTYDYVKNEFAKRNYYLISTYIDCKIPIEYICLKHKDKGILSVKWGDFQQGKGCRYCGIERKSDKRKLTYLYVKNEFKKRNYQLISKEYDGNKNDLEYICLKHIDKGIQKIKYEKFQMGRGCKYCNKIHSKLESRIKNYLDENDVKYNIEHRISHCKNSLTLPFDFAIFDKSNCLIFLLEADGIGHFKPIRFGGISIEKAEEKLRQQQINDKIKTNYCKQNNIPLLRIPYWDYDNIEEILEKELIKYNLNQQQL